METETNINQIRRKLSLISYFQSEIIYKQFKYKEFDIYYNDHGHPKCVHDAFGGDAVDDFVYLLMNEIINKTNAKEIYRVDCAAFAIEHEYNNVSAFTFNYKGLKHNILKKTIIIQQV